VPFRVLDESLGGVCARATASYFIAFDELRNLRGGTFEMDKTTAARAAFWVRLDDVWVFGCFKWDWADMNTPVKSVDSDHGIRQRLRL